ncbi:glycosyltransferase family 4 protein [Kocuria sp. JC486]|uniref:D-inositol 3-phosphate glycosyltransferase n=1 Tax=Kocuria soli TaxID=2485125 RepID=A0A3N3ZYC9_9MICC|nr:MULTISPECIES: glycosyltransferase family 4 protein [Kocuria]NHU84253.1 glycosyltransferase family 4 protein [Kocuria sp. JC486]ROZ63769.1 glycosyltransferase WbuB [Kocuria soli]
MNVLLLTHSYWPEHSPPQRRWQALTRHLRNRGWALTVVAPVAHYSFGPDYSPTTRGRVLRRQTGPLGERILRVPFITGRDDRLSKLLDQLFTAAGSCVRALTCPRPDVVVITAPSLPLMAAAWAAAKLRRVPLVVEMRDAWPNLVTDSGVALGLAQSVINWAVEFVQNHADLVVTVTEGFAETLRERGVTSVATVRNGVMLSRTPALPPVPLRSRLEVLYLGNHGESQRLERLIDAARLVGEDMRLTMVGQGSQKAILKAYAQSRGVDVRFLDPVFRDEVFAHYEAADSLVISLRDDWRSFEATIPSKTYEVMAVGRHITGVVKGEAARILEAAGTGHIVGGTAEEIAQLWRRLAEDRGLLAVDDAGRRWVSAHADYKDLADQYDDLLTDLLGATPGDHDLQPANEGRKPNEQNPDEHRESAS